MKNHLKLVSFTGADEKIQAQELVDFTKQYSNFFIEWALLYYPEMETTPRNPSKNKRDAFLKTGLTFAAHLCGKEVFQKILLKDPFILQDLKQYNRVQININARNKDFTDEEVIFIYDTLSHASIPLILQYNNDSKNLIEQYLKNTSFKKIDVLLDGSKGMGISPENWPKPVGQFCGYAGGLNPGNIAQNQLKIEQLFRNSNCSYWLDMETGIRIKNEFSLSLCSQVLENLSEI